MPKLPLDQTQWGYAIQANLLQKHRSLDANIVRTQILDGTPEGLTFGFVVLTRGVVPFVVKEGDLQPMDLLLDVDDAGEIQFQALTERNSFALVGGVPIGDPVTQKVDVNSNPPINYAGMPGMYNRGRGASMPGGALFSATQPVKLASEAIQKAPVELIEEFLKAASASGIHEALVKRYEEGLKSALFAHKQASDESRPTLVVLEPKHGADFRVQKVAAKTDKGDFDLTVKQASDLARELYGMDKTAELIRGDILHWTDRMPGSFYSNNTAAAGGDTELKEPGVYQVNGEPAKVFATTYLDGKPCTYMLTATPSGYSLAGHAWGRPLPDGLDNERMKAIYRHTSMNPGEICFLFNPKTGSATIPFKVQAVVGGGDVLDATVEPIMGDGPVRLTFSSAERPYKVEEGHLMFPNRGWQVFALNPKLLSRPYGGVASREGIKVVVLRGGSMFKVIESGNPAYGPLTHGELAFLLTDRYEMAPEAAHEMVAEVKKMGRAEFTGKIREEEPNPVFDTTKIASLTLGCDLHKFASSLEAEAGWLTRAQEQMFELLTKAAAPAPEASGPNRPMEENPAQSGIGGPGMDPAAPMDPGTAIPQGPEAPGVQDIADMLVAYAMGQTAPGELEELYTGLIDKLNEAENMLGRVLLLVQMQQAEFITYAEAKRLLEEIDKFRATLLNASMLQSAVSVDSAQASSKSR